MVNRMFRVLGFICLIIALMGFAGGEQLINLALLFISQSVLFFILSYMGLTEKTYMYIFFSYMFISFVALNYWMFFVMPLS